jgi:hypothetical protein
VAILSCCLSTRGNHAIIGLRVLEVTGDRRMAGLGRGPGLQLVLVAKLRNVPERLADWQSWAERKMVIYL